MTHLEFFSRKPDKPDLSFLHLQVELIRIDLLIHRAVRRWQTANRQQAALDEFHGQYISDAEIAALLRQPLGMSWWQGLESSPGEQQVEADILAHTQQRRESLRQTAREQGKVLRLDHLVNNFGLTDFERDALLLCLAPTLDRRYERFYGYLQDDATRRWPTVNLILDLLCEPEPRRLLKLADFEDNMPLRQNQLLVPAPEIGVAAPSLLNQAMHPDKTLVSWLLGHYQPHAGLGRHANLEWPKRSLETDRILVGDILPGTLQPAGAAEDNQPPIFAFYGIDTARQKAAGRLAAAYRQRPLLVVDLAALLAKSGSLPLETVQLALRDARLTGAIPYLSGWEHCLNEGTPAAAMFAQLSRHPWPVIIASRQKWLPEGIERERPLLWIEFTRPDYQHRRVMWQHFLPAPSELFDVTSLANSFVFTSGQIQDAIASGQDTARRNNRQLTEQDLFSAARTHSNPRLVTLARKIEPRYSWSDIILPADQVDILREMVDTIRGRTRVLYEWDVRRKLVSSAGVTALFAGPPGTGKTMAAEVIAGELSLDLYKIDLSTVVSKYIGETEKNLEKIFAEAETSNAILFFDEADALFGKRSEVRDAHDRYANIEISYLLQRMEVYDGVTVLATNLRANLDEAFTRRLQFVVDFPVPQEEERLRMWQTLFPPTIPSQPNLDLALMARRFKLSGGNIRNIIVSAAFLAAADGGTVTMEHLLHGTRRELQKMGRITNDHDLQV